MALSTINARDILVIRKCTTTTPASRDLTFWAPWLTAISLIILLFFAQAVIKTGEVDTKYRILPASMLLGSVSAYSMAEAHHKHLGYLVGLGVLFAGCLAPFCGLTVVALITKTSEQFSRQVITP